MDGRAIHAQLPRQSRDIAAAGLERLKNLGLRIRLRRDRSSQRLGQMIQPDDAALG